MYVSFQSRSVETFAVGFQVDHQNVVRLRSITTTRAFNDPSVLFAYDFYPNAMTLETFVENEGRLLNEGTIWSFATQIVSGLHAIHSEGLAARILGEKRILITGLDSCTVRINCVAMSEVIDVSLNQEVCTDSRNYSSPVL